MAFSKNNPQTDEYFIKEITNNNQFNLNMFLNVTCKDAMNISEFVESIQFQLTDLERLGEIGYVEGISNIIVKNLNKLDITQRPVHCTDKKRETMYIKDEDQWMKEDDKKSKLRKVIKTIADKNILIIHIYISIKLTIFYIQVIESFFYY